MITKPDLHEDWNQLVGAVKGRYAQITNSDLASLKGDVQQLSKLIQRKTGQARHEVDAFLRSMSESANNTYDRFVDAAGDLNERAAESARDGYDYVRSTSRKGMETANDAVQTHPTQSLLIALGVGVATGLFLGISYLGGRR